MEQIKKELHQIDQTQTPLSENDVKRMIENFKSIIFTKNKNISYTFGIDINYSVLKKQTAIIDDIKGIIKNFDKYFEAAKIETVPTDSICFDNETKKIGVKYENLKPKKISSNNY
ncbi:MAG: hypothetical protein N4A49_09390 [Marinifilaceae bacterium]|jgi:hypothetical protein|nr:hypothetical protein [Marinifilaceae bacterium]